LFLYGFVLEKFYDTFNEILLGITIIFLILSISCWYKELFFNLKLKKPEIRTTIKQALTEPEKYNLAEFLNFEVALAVNKSLRFIKLKKDKSNGVTSGILFYFLLKSKRLNFIFSRALLDAKEVEKTLRQYYKIMKENKLFVFKDGFSEDFQNTILESLKVAEQKNHQRVEIGDILIALTRHNLIFQEVINASSVRADDIEDLVQWFEFLEQKIEQNKSFWEWDNLIKKGSLAKDWASGFTLTLDRFSIDLSEVAKRRAFAETIWHQKEIENIERILVRQKNNNVLLVGEPGVGKKGIIQGLALRSRLGKSLPDLNYKRIVALDIPAILTQAQSREDAQAILDKIFQETAFAGNVILTINNFHNFVRMENQPGIIDITGILSSYLLSSNFQIIAITTYDGLHKYIERKPGIMELFEKVEGLELSHKETLFVLQNLSLFYEQKYKKFISFSALKKIIFLADRYIPNVLFPGKAINLLDEVMVCATLKKDKIILPEHIIKVVSKKIKAPIGEAETKEKELLLDLEKLIHKRIISQKEAVKEVSTALRRTRAEVTEQKGPMGTFLFLGPSGVGKTETAKALAEIYFGSEKKVIRFDMSEFQNMIDITRLIGSTKEDGLLTTQVRENPFSIILLDEIEKAHKNILNLFLQVLDEGHLTDGLGRKIDFKNSIIIATSNAGYEIILKSLEQKKEWQEIKQNILDYIFEKAIFRPEFVNRFDATVVFEPLDKESLLDITELMLQKIKKSLKNKNINFVINKPLKDKIVELGYNPTFGARELKRVIQDKIENVLASALLSDELKKGSTVEIIIKQDEFVLEIK
jgi:ATP-dependent Clp protease ATP-binding subunit ClpC